VEKRLGIVKGVKFNSVASARDQRPKSATLSRVNIRADGEGEGRRERVTYAFFFCVTTIMINNILVARI